MAIRARVRIAILLLLAWILHRHLTDPAYSFIFAGINLGIHEMGHEAFSSLGTAL